MPHGEIVPGHVSPTLDPRSAVDAYEKALAPPAEVLAATFGLIRVSRTLVRADSIAYVFERKHDLLGREVCRAFRITDHPQPPPPSRFDPNRPLVFPDRAPDRKPVIEFVDVSCSDPRMEKVEPGSLTTPVPRHL